MIFIKLLERSWPIYFDPSHTLFQPTVLKVFLVKKKKEKEKKRKGKKKKKKNEKKKKGRE